MMVASMSTAAAVPRPSSLGDHDLRGEEGTEGTANNSAAAVTILPGLSRPTATTSRSGWPLSRASLIRARRKTP